MFNYSIISKHPFTQIHHAIAAEKSQAKASTSSRSTGIPTKAWGRLGVVSLDLLQVWTLMLYDGLWIWVYQIWVYQIMMVYGFTTWFMDHYIFYKSWWCTFMYWKYICKSCSYVCTAVYSWLTAKIPFFCTPSFSSPTLVTLW